MAGLDSPYERPDSAELVLDTVRLTPEAAAEAVLAELERRGVIPGLAGAAPSSRPASWTEQVRRHVERRASLDVSLDQACEELGVGRRRLARLLQAEGSTFTDILAEVRRERAVALLRDTDLPLKRVATEAGFRSGPSFTMAFRSWTGMTPKAFRRSGRGDAGA